MRGARITPHGIDYYEYEPEPTQVDNDQIKAMRAQAYKDESDSLYMAYQKYVALGDADRAGVARSAWLDKVREIDIRLPYV
jgi:hypothetical protein